MALWLQDNQRVMIKKFRDGKENIKRFEKYTTASLSSSRKNQDSDLYTYSDWDFARFVGKAHEFMKSAKEGDLILLEKAQLTKEPYMKDGVKTYPKGFQMVVFSCSLARTGKAREEQNQEDEMAELPPEEEIPF